MKKFLAVDIGNTSIHFAYYEKGRWAKHASISSRATDKAILAFLNKHFAGLKNTEVVIASVVPQTDALLKIFFSGRPGVRARVIGRDIPIPIVNRYRDPKQVGVDRLMNSIAGYKRYKKALIIIDFGTAITFDVVSKKGEYLGGVIAPGIEISLEALFQKTALLPRIKLQHPKNLVGRDTTESIRVGCSVGIGGLCDRVVEAITRKYGMKPKVLATGGYAVFMKKYCRSIQVIEPNLILDGIRLTNSLS